MVTTLTSSTLEDELHQDHLAAPERELQSVPQDPIVSGRVCLFIWDGSIMLDSIVRLLEKLRQVSQETRASVVTIVLVSPETPLPGVHVRNALRGVLPAILDRCQELLIVAARQEHGYHLLLRAMFSPTGFTQRSTTRFFVTLDEALAVAQRLAPHDTLAVQRALLRRPWRD